MPTVSMLGIPIRVSSLIMCIITRTASTSVKPGQASQMGTKSTMISMAAPVTVGIPCSEQTQIYPMMHFKLCLGQKFCNVKLNEAL